MVWCGNWLCGLHLLIRFRFWLGVIKLTILVLCDFFVDLNGDLPLSASRAFSGAIRTVWRFLASCHSSEARGPETHPHGGS